MCEVGLLHLPNKSMLIYSRLQLHGTNMISEIDYKQSIILSLLLCFFKFYLTIIHLPDFVEPLCLMIPNFVIFLIWYLMPSRVMPIDWANSFWVISGFAWIAAKILSWVVSPPKPFLNNPKPIIYLSTVCPRLSIDIFADCY